ncbi:hypothetical protein DFH09DRAFT_1152238 [Mycena vulgaris]|nr:hypothetical protein DFH09DRAFT_1152238 [Mycena vulgaris]
MSHQEKRRSLESEELSGPGPVRDFAIPVASSRSQLHFDPGPTTSRARSTSCCNICLGAIGALCVAFILIFMGKAALSLGKGAYGLATFAHRGMYQNQTIDQVRNWSMVVQPLVGDDQTFDIAATVWTLAEETGPDEEKRVETALFTDVVFRGLRLKEKFRSVDVDFQVPTSMFRRPLINGTDLRASFVLIPTSPSPLDHLKSYSTWYPPTFHRLPLRNYSTERSLVDEALDSFGISVSLLTSAEVPSKCQRSNDEDGDELNDEEEDDEALEKPKDVLKDHPFIRTRTQIRVSDETHIFNRRAYDRAHKKLKMTACSTSRNFTECNRNYTTNGHWETRLELAVPDESGSVQNQFAYVPYLVNLGGLDTYKDLLRVPVTRQQCANLNTTMAPIDQDVLNVTWHLSYSGRTPEKLTMGEMYGSRIDLKWNMSQSDHALDQNRLFVEGLNGLFGLRHPEAAHPRRQFFAINAMQVVLVGSWILLILEAHYWRGRNSTVNISLSGTVLSAASQLLSDITRNMHKTLLALAFIIMVTDLPQILMLKAVSRVDILQLWWIPGFRLVPPNHLERASARMDARTGWKWRVGVFMALFLTCAFLKPQEIFIISPTLLPPPASTEYSFFRTHILSNFCRTASLLGPIFQLLLNHRSRVFAGMYKTTVCFEALLIILKIGFGSPHLFGQANPSFTLSVLDLAAIGTTLWTCWQAVILPRPKDEAEDESVD